MVNLIFSNPSLHFRRVHNCELCIEKISKINEIVGEAQLEGKPIKLKFKCEDIQELPDSFKELKSTWRARLSFEGKYEKMFRGKRVTNLTTYISYFYILVAGSPGIIFQQANSTVAGRTWQVLNDQGVVPQVIRFEDEVQSALLSQPNIIKYGSLVRDDVSIRTGDIRVRGQTPTTDISDDDPTTFAEGRGPRKALGLTLLGTPQVTFWVYREGKILIRSPSIDESVVFDLVRMVLGSL